jgi:L-Lysine epsilon oxidase N-terminal
MEKIALDQAVVNEAIVKAAIYPSIGIARVGNSLTGWYVGPEVPDPLPLPPGSYRDDAGALKREASRFRIYGLNAAGTIVRELTSADADITWTVQLANKKAAWYGFQLALDIPEASPPGSTPTTLRNPLIADRKALAITPEPRTISGASQPEQRFDDGAFMGIRRRFRLEGPVRRFARHHRSTGGGRSVERRMAQSPSQPIPYQQPGAERHRRQLGASALALGLWRRHEPAAGAIPPPAQQPDRPAAVPIAAVGRGQLRCRLRSRPIDPAPDRGCAGGRSG